MLLRRFDDYLFLEVIMFVNREEEFRVLRLLFRCCEKGLCQPFA